MSGDTPPAPAPTTPPMAMAVPSPNFPDDAPTKGRRWTKAPPPPSPSAVDQPSKFSADLLDDALLEGLPKAWRDLIQNGDEDALRKLDADISAALATRKMHTFVPYPKQAEFIVAGRGNAVRLLMAGNRSGKSEGVCYESAIHLTGQYPEDWQGKRFPGPIKAWMAGVSAKTTRDILQSKMIGDYARKDQWGTGFLPKASLDLDNVLMLAGVTHAIDTISVRHISGGWSTLSFLSYQMGADKFQGTDVHWIVLDEQPAEAKIFSECLTRTATVDGSVALTFTPLLGANGLVRQFISPEDGHKPPGVVIRATIRDNLSIPPEQMERIIAAWPEHERAARELGEPFLGSGAIFPISDEAITVDPFPIPPHWPVIIGQDHGWDHPAAAVKMAHDRETDTIYVIGEYRQREAKISEIAAAMRGMGAAHIPVAWPHDSLQHDRNSGKTFADLYREQGLNMLPERATFEDGGYSVEAGLQIMMDRMTSGRWKVFSTCRQWLEEKRGYHRKEGKVVALADDAISASRYGLMSLRFAEQASASRNYGKPLKRSVGYGGNWRGR